MPGHPIDPTNLIRLVQDGAGWHDNRLIVENAPVFLVDKSGVWDTAAAPDRGAHLLDRDAYLALEGASPIAGNAFTYRGVSYTLASVLKDGSLWASLARI